MKVLHIIQRYPPAIGGSEVWCRNICRFLAAKGLIINVSTIRLYKVEECTADLPVEDRYVSIGEYDNDESIFIRRYPKYLFCKASVSLKIINFLLYKLKFIKTNMGHIFRNSPNSFAMYRNLFREIKAADIVHLHTMPYFHNIVGYYIAKIYRKKIVITPHFHPGHKEYEKPILYNIMNNCDAVITVSSYEKDYLKRKGVNPDKIFVTGNALLYQKPAEKQILMAEREKLFRRYLIPVDGAKKILFIGRKELYKGIGDLIQAVEELTEKNGMNILLFLVGPSTLDFSIKYGDYIENNKGKMKIVDFGEVSDMEKEALLEACDMLALPSQYEAFGIVFLEAWKYGKPVIGPGFGAVPEVIKNAGLCVEYGNITDLKGKIKLLLSDKKLALDLGKAGKKKVEKEYSLENIGNKVLNVYSNLNSYKRRALIVSNFFPPHCDGGAEIAAYEQARCLKRMGFDVTVFTGKQDDKKIQYEVKIEKKPFKITRVNFHAVDFKQDIVCVKNDFLQGEFKKILYEVAPDIVHFHNLYGFPLGMIDDCRNMNIPMVMTLHDYWWLCYRKTLRKNNGVLCGSDNRECLDCAETIFLDKSAAISMAERNSLLIAYLNSINLLISPSEYLAKKFIDNGVLSHRLKIINNGIDTKRFHELRKVRSKKIRFGFIGTLREHKGLENLLKGVALLRDKGETNFSLTIVGKGDAAFTDYLKRIVKDMMLINFVYFYGEINNKDIRKIYENIDLLVVPSVWPENSPVTIMEAFAAGTPVLASNIGGIPELIEHGVHGYLHRYDDPVSLAENMKKIISQPDKIKIMKEACLKKACDLTIKKQVSLIIKEYKHLTW